MTKVTTVNIFGQPNDILDLKIRYDKTVKNILSVGEDMLKIEWNCMKITLII